MKLGIISPRIFIRRALSSFIASTGSALVVLEGASVSENLDEVKSSQADTLILDVSGPRGVEGLSQLHKLGLNLKVLVLMDNLDNEFCARALQLGAWGYISTTQSPRVFQQALSAVSRGERWAPHGTSENRPENKNPAQRVLEGLTPREWEVLALLANGYRNKEISSRLSICEETAKSHIKSIYKKLKIKGRRDAIVRYFEYGYRPSDQTSPDVEGRSGQSSSLGPEKS